MRAFTAVGNLWSARNWQKSYLLFRVRDSRVNPFIFDPPLTGYPLIFILMTEYPYK